MMKAGARLECEGTFYIIRELKFEDDIKGVTRERNSKMDRQYGV